MRRTHRFAVHAYTLTRSRPVVWTLRYGRHVRCVWSGPWPAAALLHLAAEAVAAETGTAVRWHRLAAVPGRAVFVPLRHRTGEKPSGGIERSTVY